MPYEINKRDDVASSIVVADGALNSSALSIVLIGRGWDGYGEQLQENIVHVMENFSNSTPPLNPTYGQLWFDKTSDTLHVYQTDDSWRNTDDYFDESIYDIAIAPDADIDLSKLIHGSAAQILVANASGILAYQTVGGDIAIDHTGNVTLNPDTVSTAELADGLYLNAGLIDASNLNVGSSLNVTGDASFAFGTISATTNSLAIQGTNAALITLDDLAGAGGAEMGLGVTGDDLYFYRPKDLGGTQVPAALGAGRQLMRLEYINGLWLNNDASIVGDVTITGSITASTAANITTDLTVGGNFDLTGRVTSNLVTDAGAEGLQLKAGTQDYSYIGFYPRTSSSSTRVAQVGFATVATNDFTIKNEANNADLILSAQGSGTIKLEADLDLNSNDIINATSITASGNILTTGWIQSREQMYIGDNGYGDSELNFYDDNTDAWRTIRWNDANNQFEYEDNTGSFTAFGTISGTIDADTLDGLDSTEFFRLNSANGSTLRFSSGDGIGVRFWDSDNYKIYMSIETNGTWGGDITGGSDYNMYFRMAGGTTRGFVFKNDATSVAEITGTGDLHIVGDHYKGTELVDAWKLESSLDTTLSTPAAYTIPTTLDFTGKKQYRIIIRGNQASYGISGNPITMSLGSSNGNYRWSVIGVGISESATGSTDNNIQLSVNGSDIREYFEYTIDIMRGTTDSGVTSGRYNVRFSGMYETIATLTDNVSCVVGSGFVSILTEPLTFTITPPGSLSFISYELMYR